MCVYFLDAVNFTKIATDLYNTSSKSNAFLKQVLGISESDIDEEGDENDTESFSYGIVVVIILASLVAVGVCAAFTVFLIKWLKRFVGVQSYNVSEQMLKSFLQIV